MSEDRKVVYNYVLEDKFREEDLLDRRLFVNEDISSETFDGIGYWILKWNRDDIGVPIEERKPIRMYINSPGGVVSDGYIIIDEILNSKTPVYTINMGLAASMAFLIYIAGHKRYSMPHAQFLNHDGSMFDYGSTLKVKDRVEFEAGQVNQMTKEFVLSRTKIDSETYDEKERKEWYFLPHEARDEVGAVDFIIGEDCEMDEIL